MNVGRPVLCATASRSGITPVLVTVMSTSIQDAHTFSSPISLQAVPRRRKSMKVWEFGKKGVVAGVVGWVRQSQQGRLRRRTAGHGTTAARLLLDRATGSPARQIGQPMSANCPIGPLWRNMLYWMRQRLPSGASGAPALALPLLLDVTTCSPGHRSSLRAEHGRLKTSYWLSSVPREQSLVLPSMTCNTLYPNARSASKNASALGSCFYEE